MEVFLISPIDNSKERLLNETLVWSNVDSQTTNYDVYISKDSKFTDIQLQFMRMSQEMVLF